MSLTDRELQQVREIERRLTIEDPPFARRMSGHLVSLRDPGSGRRSGPAQMVVWVTAGMAAYLVFAILVVLAVSGTIGTGALRVSLAVDVLVLLGVIATGHHLGRTPRSPRVLHPSVFSPPRPRRHRRRPEAG